MELGIRGALGADPRRLVRTVMREVVVVTTVGVVLGTMIAGAGSRVLRNVLFEIDPLDTLPFVAAPALILLVSSVAVALPAFRVLRLSLVEILRQH